MSDLIKYAIIFGIIYLNLPGIFHLVRNFANQEVIIRRDDGWDWRSPPYLQNRYLPTVN